MAYKLHLNENELSNTYYISDIHFGHKDVIKFDDRPYSTVEEMDSDMIRIWNETIPEHWIWVGDCIINHYITPKYQQKLNSVNY